VKVTIYVEGGGDYKSLKTDCRKGFRSLLERDFQSRMPQIVACGGREQAFDKFKTAVLSNTDDRISILLVDSEDPVTSDPWEHLKARDKWDRPADANEDQAQFMATCMETWIVADRDALRRVFGANLQESALPPLNNLEQRRRDDVQAALAKATRDCGRHKAYRKGHRSFQVLLNLEPATLKTQLFYFRRLIETLDKYASSRDSIT
jgi:hypothetical protein